MNMARSSRRFQLASINEKCINYPMPEKGLKKQVNCLWLPSAPTFDIVAPAFDFPGTDLSTEAGRHTAPFPWQHIPLQLPGRAFRRDTRELEPENEQNQSQDIQQICRFFADFCKFLQIFADTD